MTLDGVEDFLATGERDRWTAWHAVPPELLWQEAQSLTFEDKVAATLTNLVLAEEEMGTGARLGLGLEPYPGSYAAAATDEHYPMGILYGCLPGEGLMVLQYLREQGWIVAGPNGTHHGVTIYITPRGYAAADQIKRGESEADRKAFLICRFNDALDHVYREVYQIAGDHPELRCPVHRVKDVEHVDRIDDRIMREIESATIIIVDLTDALDNFNVALEAGYALALDKPIVWTKRDDGEAINLPFDIHSQNLMSWKREGDDYGDFLDRLQARMKVAIDKALGSRR
ncbi:hypothetical protein FCG40_01950 [Fimbriimonadia bacterium ATM]|nr:MAG: hypothetical protein EDM73_09535 [Armatimonadota bacterium]MCE7899658.1 hypothetical protein [Armatimonadetes bacterium ATM1]MDL1927743.1 hypothetical protein [Fimbriimonadia bacterium ATM]RIJ95353.1 MAG: hypothetical protein DCC45_10420 [Armatimonadota bacterium]